MSNWPSCRKNRKSSTETVIVNPIIITLGSVLNRLNLNERKMPKGIKIKKFPFVLYRIIFKLKCWLPIP